MVTAGKESISPEDLNFVAQFVTSYEAHSAASHRPYEVSAQHIVESDANFEPGSVIVEVGCGTGNSTIVFGELRPTASKIIAIDRSKDFLRWAGYKFARHKLDLEVSAGLPDIVTNYFQEMRGRASLVRPSVEFMEARAQQMTALPSGTADRVYASHSLHWFTFADDDEPGLDRDYLSEALNEISRILKSGGRFMFNSSGLQFDFGSVNYEGRPLNSYHVMNHPFHLAFASNLRQLLENAELLGESPREFEKLDKYHGIFDIEFLKNKLVQSGLEMEDLEVDAPFRLWLRYKSPDEIIDWIKNGGNMRYFNYPPLTQVDIPMRIELIDNALQLTLAQSPDLLLESGAETIATFSSIKTS